MRILFLSDNFPPEGNAPATRLYEHAVRWVRDGHDVTVITCAPNFPEGKLFPGYENSWRDVQTVDGIRVVRVKTYIAANSGFVKRSIDYASFMLMGFANGLFEPSPDVVVATSPQFFCAIGGWALSRVRSRPFVFELRDLWPASIVAVGAMQTSPTIRLLESVEMFLYRQATTIVAVTEAFREELADRGIERGKIHVVINGVDLDRYQPRPRDLALAKELSLEGKFVAAYVGTHGMAHALDGVLDAAERLIDHPEIAILLAGSGADRDRVERLVSERGLHNVRLVSRQPKERMPALWSLCDVALVPLRNSSVFAKVIPSKIFESMGMGVPIVMSLPEGEATAIIRKTGAGICVPPEDPEALAEALKNLAGAPAELARLRKNALDAAPLYSREALARVMLQILVQSAKA